jgi:enoyl-CoA hydratase/carnithine racemase
MYKTIAIHEDGAVGSILLNRPEARNAFSIQLISELEAAAKHFDAQKHIKVVVISAAGPSFCAGADLAEFSLAGDSSGIRHTVDAGRRMIQTIAAMRAITVAEVRGHCVGGGVVLMMACDFRYAATEAQFRLPEAELGLPFAWGGTAWLTREIGPLLTAELILTGRQLSGEAAEACRLINRSVTDATLSALVEEQTLALISRPAIILETTKAQIAAAKQALCADGYAYSDSHALHSALTDSESMLVRDRYLARIATRSAGAAAKSDL